MIGGYVSFNLFLCLIQLINSYKRQILKVQSLAILYLFWEEYSLSQIKLKFQSQKGNAFFII